MKKIQRGKIALGSWFQRLTSVVQWDHCCEACDHCEAFGEAVHHGGGGVLMEPSSSPCSSQEAERERGKKGPGIRYLFPGHVPYQAPPLNNASYLESIKELFQPIPKAHEQATKKESNSGAFGELLTQAIP